MTRLFRLWPLPTNFNSQASGVNNAGTVVGFYQSTPNSNSTFDGFVDTGGAISTLAYPGATSTQALGINDLGQIVGDYVDAGDVMHGSLDNNGDFLSRAPSGSTGTSLNGINDQGMFVGVYSNAAGSSIGTVGTVPEPASMLLLGVGVAGLGAVRRRQTKSLGN